MNYFINKLYIRGENIYIPLIPWVVHWGDNYLVLPLPASAAKATPL